jgi:hypothetical protein
MKHHHMITELRDGIPSYFDTSVLIHDDPLQAYSKFRYFAHIAKSYPNFLVPKMIYEEIRCRHLDRKIRRGDVIPIGKGPSYPLCVNDARRELTATLKDYNRVRESDIHTLPQFKDAVSLATQFYGLSLPDVNLALTATMESVRTRHRVIIYTCDSGIQGFVREIASKVKCRVDAQSLCRELSDSLLNIYKEGFVPL